MPHLIWFHLVDSDGQPYKASSASTVSLSPSAHVNEFLQAVINANPSLLSSSYDTSLLKIYKDKEAFDRKEEIMQDDFIVSGFGLSDREALIVLVPAPAISNSPKRPRPFWGFWGLSFLMTHELDAVNCQEWRMLPLLNFLDDNAGYQVFTILHVPIFAGIIYGFCFGKNGNRLLSRLSVFNIIHTGLHLLALWCPRNQFSSPLSGSLIIGGGFCGAMHVFQNLNVNTRKFKNCSSSKQS
jgi:hypothetical protein